MIRIYKDRKAYTYWSLSIITNVMYVIDIDWFNLTLSSVNGEVPGGAGSSESWDSDPGLVMPSLSIRDKL